MTRKIAIVIGTRAQLVKMAPVMLELQNNGIDYWFLHTGQHHETIDDLRADFGIKNPDLEVTSIKKDAKSITGFISWVFKLFFLTFTKKKQLIPFSSGVVLVHGDTASTVWGAILGRLTRNDVIHVESGLRSYKLSNPFPEEIFRLITFRLATIYACPDLHAIQNLKKYKGTKINLGGNTLFDSYKIAISKPTNQPVLPAREYVIVSIHRFETIYRSESLKIIISSIKEISRSYIVLVVAHPSLVHRLRSGNFIDQLSTLQHVELVPRMGYFSFVHLLIHSIFVVTDGGSNQEELAYMGKPTLILRKKTERLEGIGRNAILAPISVSSVANFMRHINQFHSGPIGYNHSPSQLLTNWLMKYIIT